MGGIALTAIFGFDANGRIGWDLRRTATRHLGASAGEERRPLARDTACAYLDHPIGARPAASVIGAALDLNIEYKGRSA